jgi:hypothetical protein
MTTRDGRWAVVAAYPARIRRKHGAELVDTLMEMAGPGRRPTRGEKVLLVIDGLRERFRPPVRRPLALVAAILALLVGGALGAACGSWLGTFGYSALPDGDALAKRVLSSTAGGSTSDFYLNAGEGLPAGTDVRAAVESARQKLAAEGWRPGPVKTGDGSDGVLANVHFAAETRDAHLDVYAYPDADGAPYIDIAGWPQRPPAYLPLTIIGAVLGLLAGWLAGVALAHRIRAARRPVMSRLLSALGLILVIPSAAGFVASLVRYLTIADPLGTGELVHTHGFAFGPTIDLLRAIDMGEGRLLTPSDFQQLPIWGFGLIAIAAIAARRTREDHEAVAAASADGR